MKIFIDTSALIAMLDAADEYHPRARKTWFGLMDSRHELVTSNYVLVESTALVQRRFGLGAVRELEAECVPLFTVDWADEALHRAAMVQLLMAARRNLSLVDCVSFETMRKWGIDTAFAFDKHFAEQGFSLFR